MMSIKQKMIFLLIVGSLNINAKISERNRYRKTWSTVVGWGLSVAPLPTIGGSLGYYITPNIIAELGLYRGAGLTKIGETEGRLNWKYTEARTKWFLGNSFYINAGVGQKKLDINLDFLKSPSQLLASGLSYGIGNRWQWETFSIGCDWVGAFRPLESKIDKSNVNTTIDETTREEWDELWASIGSPSNLQIFRLYMGVSL